MTERKISGQPVLSDSPSVAPQTAPSGESLVSRLRATDHVETRGPDYYPIPVPPSALRLEAAERIEALEDALREIAGCFDAAYFEGLSDRISDLPDTYAGSLYDLLLRRIMLAHDIARAATLPCAEHLGDAAKAASPAPGMNQNGEAP